MESEATGTRDRRETERDLTARKDWHQSTLALTLGFID